MFPQQIKSLEEAEAVLWPNGHPDDSLPPPPEKSSPAEEGPPTPPRPAGLRMPGIAGLVLVAVFRVSDLVEALRGCKTKN